MGNIYLFFGSKNYSRRSLKMIEKNIRQLARDKGEGIVELFDLTSANLEQLRQFSFLITPQDRVYFIDDENNEELIEDYLDMLEESMDPEKIIAVLSLSGQEEVPFQFVEAIHRLYQPEQNFRLKQNKIHDSANIGEIYYGPNPDTYTLSGLGSVEKEELEIYDVPEVFEETGTFIEASTEEESYAAEISNFILDSFFK